MSYKVYAGVQTGVDVWETKACIYDPADYTDTKKLISPTLTREVGKAGSLEFTLPLGNVAHSALQKMRTTVSVEQDGARIWEGRPMSHEQDFMLRQKVFCEGELAYLNDSSVAPYTAKDVTIKQFLSFLLENHTGMVDAYKAFTCGNVGFPSTSVVVPELHNCVMKLDYMAGTPDSDGDYRYEYGLYTSSGVQLVSQYEVGYSDDDTAPDPSAYRWTLNVKYEAASIDGHIWRTGEGLFSVSVNVALSLDGDGQTHEATQRTVTPDITCATHSKSFPPETEYNLKDTVSKKWKIEKQGDGYAVLFNGAALPDSSVVRYDSAPRYTFGDGQNFGVTWDVIQNELVDVYGGYLIVRHENGARYLDYVREVQEKKRAAHRIRHKPARPEQLRQSRGYRHPRHCRRKKEIRLVFVEARKHDHRHRKRRCGPKALWHHHKDHRDRRHRQHDTVASGCRQRGAVQKLALSRRNHGKGCGPQGCRCGYRPPWLWQDDTHLLQPARGEHLAFVL